MYSYIEKIKDEDKRNEEYNKLGEYFDNLERIKVSNITGISVNELQKINWKYYYNMMNQKRIKKDII